MLYVFHSSPPPTITSKDWIGPLTNTSRSSSASGGKVSPINNKGQSNTQRDSLASSVPMLDLSKCRINNEDIIVKSASTFNGFRPSGYRTPKTPRPPSYSNTGQEAPELVAMGTMALTTQKQVHQPPSKPVPRFKSRTSSNNKGEDFSNRFKQARERAMQLFCLFALARLSQIILIT